MLLTGAALFLVGYAPVSAESGTPLGTAIEVARQGSTVAIGLGLVAAGVSTRGARRVTLITAGIAAPLVPVVEEVLDAISGPPEDPRPGPAALLLLEIVMITASAVLLLAARHETAALRWSMTPPAVAYALWIAIDFVPFLAFAAPVQILLPGLGMLAAGALLLRSARALPRGPAVAPAVTGQR